MSEEHNTRLTQTVDKLLSESNERLQMHLKERMHSLDEKNTLTQECDKLRKQIDDLDSDKERLNIEIERLKSDIDFVKKENQNLQLKLKEISLNYSNAVKLNTTLSNTINTFKKQHKLSQSQTQYPNGPLPVTNIGDLTNSIFYATTSQTTESNANTSDNNSQILNDFNFANPILYSNQFSAQNNYSPSNLTGSLKSRSRFSINNLQPQQAQSGRDVDNLSLLDNQINKVSDCCDWDKLDEAAKVIANVQHAFELTDNDLNEYSNDDTDIGQMSSSYNKTSQRIAYQTQTSQRSMSQGRVVTQPSQSQYLLTGPVSSSSNNPITNSTSSKPNLVQKIVPHTDAQTIAILLQKQLEDIDNEIRYLLFRRNLKFF